MWAQVGETTKTLVTCGTSSQYGYTTPWPILCFSTSGGMKPLFVWFFFFTSVWSSPLSLTPSSGQPSSRRYVPIIHTLRKEGITRGGWLCRLSVWAGRSSQDFHSLSKALFLPPLPQHFPGPSEELVFLLNLQEENENQTNSSQQTITTDYLLKGLSTDGCLLLQFA